MTKLTERAPAKINLSLHVGPPKENGRHDLLSLVTFADAHAADILTAEPSNHFSLAVEGPFAKAAGPAKDNLVLQAARALNELMDDALPPLAFRLQKNLPCAAGIGGGSADAGAALRLMIRAHGGDLVQEHAKAISPHLGGDVLACFIGMPGLMSGEGETYEPMLGLPPLAALLVNSGAACPTGQVFKSYDQIAPSSVPQHPLPAAGRARADDFISWLTQETRNNLEHSAMSLVPEITSTLGALQALPGSRLIRMSGSGATCFALFENMEAAENAGQTLAKQNPDWWVKASLLGGSI